MGRFTHLGRTLDLRRNDHRFMVLLAAATGVFVLWVQVEGNQPLGTAAGRAAAAAIAGFLTWAIAREIDPDRPGLARLGMVAFAAGALLHDTGLPLLPAAALLLGARISARTVGLPLLPADAVLVAVAGLGAGRTLPGWIAALALAFAVARDRRLPGPAPVWTLPLAFTVAVLASVGLGVGGADPEWLRPRWVEAILPALGLSGGLLLGPEPLVSTGDITGEPLDPRRVQSSRRLVLSAAIVMTLVAGSDGVVASAPAWAALAAAGWGRRLLPAHVPGPSA